MKVGMSANRYVGKPLIKLTCAYRLPELANPLKDCLTVFFNECLVYGYHESLMGQLHLCAAPDSLIKNADESV